jgi:hypothetical protein
MNIEEWITEPLSKEDLAGWLPNKIIWFQEKFSENAKDCMERKAIPEEVMTQDRNIYSGLKMIRKRAI